METLNELEERILIYFWNDSEGSNVTKHLLYYASNEEEIKTSLERLKGLELLISSPNNHYRTTLKARKMYKLESACLENGGVSQLVPKTENKRTLRKGRK